MYTTHSEGTAGISKEGLDELILGDGLLVRDGLLAGDVLVVSDGLLMGDSDTGLLVVGDGLLAGEGVALGVTSSTVDKDGASVMSLVSGNLDGLVTL